MEIFERKSAHGLILSLLRRGSLILPIYFIFALLSPDFTVSVLGNDQAEPGNSYLLDYLHHTPENEITERYGVAGEMFAQADGTEYYAQGEAESSTLSGAAGYYGTKDWQAFVAVYLWFVGMNGETGKGNFISDVDMSFGDIWDNLDVGAQGHIEFWWKKWLFYVDPIFVKVTAKNSQTSVISSIRSKLQVKMFLMDIAAGYRVAEIPLGTGTKSNNFKTWPALSIDLYGGGRILSIDTKLDLTLETPIGTQGRRIKVDESWFDFIVGTRFIFDFTENLLLTVKTDIGGFGLGFSSDIDWNFVANVGYQLPWWGLTPYLGYRVLYIDYKNGSGDNRFVYDMWNTGPQVGLGVRF